MSCPICHIWYRAGYSNVLAAAVMMSAAGRMDRTSLVPSASMLSCLFKASASAVSVDRHTTITEHSAASPLSTRLCSWALTSSRHLVRRWAMKAL